MTDDNADRRRLALGDQLRQLREPTGMTGKALAELLHWPASKVSRIELARQFVTDADLVAMCRALAVDEQFVEQLRDELRGIRLEESRWARRLRVGHRAVQESVALAEQDATRIRVVALTLVPGLLQTSEYARAVFVRLSELNGTPADTDAAVRARIDRQAVLFQPDRRIELLLTETALNTPIASPLVMLGQVDRLLAVQGLPSLRLGVLPAGARMPAVIQHDFSIKGDAVVVEMAHTEMVTRDPADLALYERLADALWGAAVEGEEARALLGRVAAEVRAQLGG